MIRDASDNRHSLDDVMRELYRTTYKQGRGFTGDDWWGAVRRASNGRSYEEFQRRYVGGRDPYPWDEALKVVGLRLQADSVPRMGVSLSPEPDGSARVRELTPGSPALGAGIKAGDVIVSVNERPAMQVFFAGGFREMYGARPAGTPIPVVVKRDSASLTIQVPLAFGAGAPRLVEDPSAAPRAVRLRNGILRGTTDR